MDGSLRFEITNAAPNELIIATISHQAETNVDGSLLIVTDEKGGEGYKSVDLQITDMAIEKPGAMDEKKVAGSLYGKR